MQEAIRQLVSNYTLENHLKGNPLNSYSCELEYNKTFQIDTECDEQWEEYCNAFLLVLNEIYPQYRDQWEDDWGEKPINHQWV